MIDKIKWFVFVINRKIKIQVSFFIRKFRKPPLPKISDKNLLHIGCGEINSTGFINIDAQPFSHVHIVTEDITNLTTFENETFDLIYMCHILEHVKHIELKKVLWEMRRVLKKGGILRISVPDFDKLIAVLNDSDGDIESILFPLLGAQNNRFNCHYSIFNHQYLSQLLRKNNFSEVRIWDPKNCKYHDFEDFASKQYILKDKEYNINLNLEAIK